MKERAKLQLLGQSARMAEVEKAYDCSMTSIYAVSAMSKALPVYIESNTVRSIFLAMKSEAYTTALQHLYSKSVVES